MLEIAVCEDDRYQQGELEEMLYGLGKKHGIGLEVDVYESGEALLRASQSDSQYDLVFLDIEMEGMDGVEVAARLRERDRTVQVVYVTHYDRYLKESVRTMPSGYITKPVSPEEFEEAFVRISGWILGKDEYFRFYSDKVPCKVLIRTILYFKSDLRRAEVVCEETQYKIYKKLSEIEVEMKRSVFRFLRIHQSYLVNYSQIRRVRHDSVELTTGERLPVSRRYRGTVEEDVNQLMIKGM